MPPQYQPARRLFLYLSSLGALYTLAFCIAVPFYIDEAYTFNLATDSSLAHMLRALKEGADGSFPLFGVLVFAWDKFFGSSELSLRLASGLFVVVLIVHCGRHLTRRFATVPALLALLLILANQKFIFYAVQARFYGLLLCAFSLAFWSTWDLIEDETVTRSRWLRHSLFCGLLWISHPLGMIYGTILLLLYAGLAFFNRTFSLTNAAAFLGGPLFFLAWLPSFMVQRQISVVYPSDAIVDRFHEYREYLFLDSTAFCVVSLLGIGLFAANARKRRNSVTTAVASPAEAPRSSGYLLVVYATAFIVILNAVIALLDASGALPIYLMRAVRYVVVAVVAYGVVFAATLEQLDQVVRRGLRPRWAGIASRAHQSALAMLLLFALGTTWSRWMEEKAGREPYLKRAAELALENGLDLYCESHLDAFFLTTRTSATRVKYYLADDFPFRSLMLRMHSFYPQPTPIPLAEFQHPSRDIVRVLSYGQANIVSNGHQPVR